MKAKLTKPPMGWNSWDCYGASVTEEEVRRNAEYGEKFKRSSVGSMLLLTYSGLSRTQKVRITTKTHRL